MVALIAIAVLYALGAMQMVLLVVEWDYTFTLRTVSVIVAWPIVAAVAFVGAMFVSDAP